MKTADLVTFPARPSSPFPEDGRRALIYVVYDPRGDVEQYIAYALAHLREHCDYILVVVNGLLTEAGREVLAPLADLVIVRENRGFDIWGYKEGLDALSDSGAEFDEVVLANDTWFGPVRPFDLVFDRMNRKPLHFWGMTDHGRVEPHPFTHEGYLPYHLQSYWLAVRREMLLSPEWRAYWRDLPPLDSYEDAVVKHEGTFTERFTQYGFTGEVAFPMLTDKIENHSVLYAEQLLDAGCPTLKRRPFFQWPPFLDRLAVIGRWTLQKAAAFGYPVELMLEDLARNVAPRTLNADAAMLEVLPDADVDYDPAAPLRTVVIAHVFYVDMLEEMLDRAGTLPGPFDLIITTPDAAKAGPIREVLERRFDRGRSDVRVVASNNGRDQSAFLIGCRDVILSDDYELIVKIHSKKTPQNSFNVGRHFARQQFENLLHSEGYAANLVALFQKERRLGLAYPPTVHLGHPTLGHGWWANKPGFVELRDRLGIRVPVDAGSPLAPYGSMFFARPRALRILAEHPWTYDDFGGADAYQDGGLAHILERLPSYAAGEDGFHTRTVANADYVASSYAELDYLLDQVSTTSPGSTMDQIQLLARMGSLGEGTFEDFLGAWARMNRPGDEQRIVLAYRKTARVRRAIWAALSPRRWGRR